MTNTKKILALVLSILMVCTIVPISMLSTIAASKTAIIVETNVEYATVKDALEAVADNQTIKMLADDSLKYYGGTVFNNKVFAIDCNGYTLTCSAARMINNAVGYTLTMKNGTLATASSLSGFETLFVFRGATTVNMENMTVNFNEKSRNCGYGVFGSSVGSGGVVNFKNCTINDNCETASKYDITNTALMGYSSGNVTANYYNTTVNAKKGKVFGNASNYYTVYSGSFTTGDAFGSYNVASTSTATTATANNLVVVCNHSFVDGVCSYCYALENGAEVTTPVAPSIATTTTTTTTTTKAPVVTDEYFTPADVANNDNWLVGWWRYGDGLYDSNYASRAALAKKVEVTEGETYKFAITGADVSGLNIVLRTYDASGSCKDTVTLSSWKYKIPSGIKYVSLTMYDRTNLIDYIKAGTVSASMVVDGAEEPSSSSTTTTTTTTAPVPVEQDGATTDLVSTQEGASIRLNEANGMRFYATVNGDISNATEVGIIIAPKDIVKGQYFTMEDDHIKVPYKFQENALWDGNKIVGSIVNLKSSNAYNEATGNLARDYIARAYVVIGGVTYYAKETTVRNLAEIADKYIADEKGGYAELDADIKEMVDLWAKAND